MQLPQTFDELVELARKDVYQGRAGAAVDWIAYHARARARLALAERQMAGIEWRERDVRVRTSSIYVSNEDKAYADAMGPTPVETRNAEELLTEATERVVLTDRVLAILAARFVQPQKTTTPAQSRPLGRPQPALVNGGRR